jgi:hypothetical protein
MRRLLLAAAAVLALTGVAGAAEAPKLLLQQGDSFWCEETLRSDASVTVLQMTVADVRSGTDLPSGTNVRICRDARTRPSSFFLVDNGPEFGGWEFGWGTDSTCTPLRISKARPVRDYELEWTVVASCNDYDTRKPRVRKQTFVFNLFKGSLNTITVR